MKKNQIEPVVFPEDLCNKVDTLLSLIMTVSMRKPMESILMVEYPYDVETWATYGIALQLSGLTGKPLYIFNPYKRFANFWKLKKDLKKIKMVFSFKKKRSIKHTFIYSEMHHSISYYTESTTNFDKDFYPLYNHDYLTAAVIASYYGCPKEYISQKQLDWFKVIYKGENVVHVEEI